MSLLIKLLQVNHLYSQVRTFHYLPVSHLIVVLPVDDDHQQHGDINFHGPIEHSVFDLNLEASCHQQYRDMNFVGSYDYDVFDHNIQASDALQDGDINFDGPHEYGVFDLNLQALDHQQEMHQMISKPQITNPFYLIFIVHSLK